MKMCHNCPYKIDDEGGLVGMVCAIKRKLIIKPHSCHNNHTISCFGSKLLVEKIQLLNNLPISTDFTLLNGGKS